jgi:hypothetical protein
MLGGSIQHSRFKHSSDNRQAAIGNSEANVSTCEQPVRKVVLCNIDM